MSLVSDLLTAIQFLTRIPVPSRPYEPTALARSVKFFPAVGLLVGSLAAALHHLVTPHLSRPVTALLVVLFLVVLTGALHEDGLADAADGFGGGWTRDKILLILRDSRIGTYGGIALCLSLLGRVLLLSSIPLDQLGPTLIAAHILCRWTTLPLSFFLTPARTQQDGHLPDGHLPDGQGARIAQLTSRNSLLFASVFTLAAVIALLHTRAIAPILATLLVTALTGLYYRSRIGGVTGDCFGATNQVTEVVTYLCGAWTV